MHLERHLTLGSTYDTTPFQCAVCPIGKLHQCANIILVGDFARWTIRADSEVRSLAWGSKRTLRDESLAVAHQTLDGTGYHLRHINDMRHQIAQSPQPRHFALKTPRQHRVRIASITRKEASTIVCKPAETPFLNQLPGVLHKRCPSIIIAHTGQNACLSSGIFDRSGFLWISTDRLLAEDMLSCLGSRSRNFEVHIIRCSNVDELDLRIGKNLFPIGSVSFKTQQSLRFAGTGFHLIGADD